MKTIYCVNFINSEGKHQHLEVDSFEEANAAASVAMSMGSSFTINKRIYSSILKKRMIDKENE